MDQSGTKKGDFIMEEEEREIMLKEEEDAYNELLAEVRWVFYHPILCEWVKVAPSINSIEKWIMTQFSDFEDKTELVKAMRKAVKVWGMTKGDNRKNLLETPQSWRLSDIFVFQTPSYFLSGATGSERLKFASGIKFLPDFDNEKAISCYHWPMFLKEFGYQVGSDLKTSVDRFEGDVDQFRLVKKIGNSFWEDGKAEAFKGNPKELNSFGFKFSIRQTNYINQKKLVWTEILSMQFGIQTQIIMVAPQVGEIYPRFYKTVFFCDKRHGDLRHSIKVIWPVDCCRDDRRGWVGFSKSIKIGQQMRAVLNLDYKFNDSFKLVDSPEHVSYEPHSHVKLQISNIQQSLLFQEACPVPETKKISEAMGVLFEDFVKAWEFSIKKPNVLLGSILGESMVKTPPDSLLDIFTGSFQI